MISKLVLGKENPGQVSYYQYYLSSISKLVYGNIPGQGQEKVMHDIGKFIQKSKFKDELFWNQQAGFRISG